MTPLLSLFVATAVVAATCSPLPPNLPRLELQYPSTPWISPGDTLKRADTLQLPCISTQNLHTSTSPYLLFLIDLDVVLANRSTTVLHWYQPAMVVSQSRACAREGNDWLVSATPPGAEYIAPQPPPFTRHRYVFLLYEQDPEYEFPACFGYIFPQTLEARAGFDVRQFVRVAGLGAPVAGNFFYVDNDDSATSTGTTTTSPGGGTPTTRWLTSAPCGTHDVKPTLPAYAEQIGRY